MFGLDAGVLVGWGIVLLIAVVFLRFFDRIAGRGPKQISDAIKKAMKETQK